MNRLSTEKREIILRCLVDGQSIRGTSRITGVAINTVVKLLLDAGSTAAELQDQRLRNLPCTRLEVDEIWAFIYAKNRNVQLAKNAPPEAGDVWTWTAICADTKLVPSWRIGDRTSATALDFMDDLRSRLTERIQLTSDGHRPYLAAVREAFGGDIDYAMLVKHYGPGETGDAAHRRYSPSKCVGSERFIVSGSPDLDKISTSYAERQNLTMRMSMRRYTRLTNAFSKKLENHAAQVALHFWYYNFARKHQTLKTTPAVAAGVWRKAMNLKDLIREIDHRTPKPNRPKTYRKREVSN